jgi:hypothetical protein
MFKPEFIISVLFIICFIVQIFKYASFNLVLDSTQFLRVLDVLLHLYLIQHHVTNGKKNIECFH